jgi:hypothetical protein
VEVADVVSIEGDRLYLLSEPRGLVAFDISNIEQPREIWHDTIDGIPAALFVHKGTALAAVTDWGGPGSSPVHGSLLRAIDVQSANAALVRSEVALRGEIRDIHAVDGVYYVLREDASKAPRYLTVLTSFRVDDGGTIRRLDELPMLGASSSFAVSPTKIAVARRSIGPAGTDLTFVDIDRVPAGPLSERGSLHLPGTLRVGPEPRLDPGGRFLWVVTCGASDCGPRSTLALSSIDSVDMAAPREAGKLILPPTRGSLVAVFNGARLFLAESDGTLETRGSILYVVDLAQPDRPTLQRGSIRISGAVSNMIPIGDRLLAIASGGTSGTSTHVLVHTVELAPLGELRLLESAEFGEDWTSVAPASVPRNVVDDAGGQWLGLPFSTWDEDRRRYATGIEILRRAPHGFTSAGAVPANEWVGRVLFLRGRFIGVSASGLTVVDPLQVGGWVAGVPTDERNWR